jgi:hypothetical protein
MSSSQVSGRPNIGIETDHEIPSERLWQFHFASVLICCAGQLVMKALKSKVGMWVAAIYLLLVFVVCTPLLLDRAIHHGNGIAFLGAAILTSPLSWLMLWFLDRVTHANAFYMTGVQYYLYMGALGFWAS